MNLNPETQNLSLALQEKFQQTVMKALQSL